MNKQDIQQRLQDINLEINSLDDLRTGYDDVNIHTIEERITELKEEKINLIIFSFFPCFIKKFENFNKGNSKL
jgi:hypothetical protein